MTTTNNMNSDPRRPLSPSGVYVAGGELRLAAGARCPHPGCGVELHPHDAQEFDGGWRLVCRHGHDVQSWS